MSDDDVDGEVFGRRLVRLAQKHAARAVLIRMDGVTYVSSRGLGKLVALMKQLKPDGEVVLYGLRPNVREVFAITRLHEMFAIRDLSEFPPDLDLPADGSPIVVEFPDAVVVAYAPTGMVF